METLLTDVQNTTSSSQPVSRSQTGSKEALPDLKDINTRLNELNQRLYEKELATTYIKNELDSQKKDISKIQIRSIETLGIFVSLFTFISTSFQVLQSEKLVPESAIGLILIVGGILIMFTLLLHLSFNWHSVRSRKVIAILLSLLAVSLIYVGLKYLPQITKNANNDRTKTSPVTNDSSINYPLILPVSE